LIHDLLLFDLDGTLSDPLQGIGRSINHALEQHGHRPRPLAELGTCVGPPLAQIFTGLTGEQDVERYIASYRERYGTIGYTENTLYQGVAPTLDALRDAGIAMAVCTSKRADFAERILERFGLHRHFTFVDGGDGSAHKREQVAALRGRGAVGDATLMIGDRATDLVAAHDNRLQAAGVLWGYGSRVELSAEQPRYLFASPGEWLDLVPPHTPLP